MKKLQFLLLIITLSISGISQNKNTALIIIDIQDFYFAGGKSELVNPDQAAKNAIKILEYFRVQKMPVIHVKHNFEPGGSINKLVEPIESEKVFSKDEVNCFLNTGLKEYIDTNKIDTLVICGMQTNVCVEAAIRAGHDFGYHCILIEDACATKDLIFNETTISSVDIHNSTISTLKFYADVTNINLFLKDRTEK